ncbi:hypothetical protein [Achromobacter denitrificans]|uniref:Uncharacterized protein n=1 Tax=Achromobacter denitrificans TaxID=32002 RepID=A0ABZ3G576_ACHDE|nr:hypothetical protein [Achromobacter denitrificans]CAB3860888.1 hypothetical protein LMG1860_03324 [Achromobacter denitrificans]
MSYIARKGFLNGSVYQRRGQPIDVSGERARELLRLGLIAEAGDRAAPEPQNKMAPAPSNQAKASVGRKPVATKADGKE